MAAQKIGGVAFFKIDGVQYSYRGSATIDPALVNRKSVVNMDGDINYTEEPKAGKIELELTTVPGFDAGALNSITNSTITFEAGNGTTYIITAGFQTGETPVTTDDGKCKVVFEGKVVVD
jgi:hypothetical protein